MSHDECWNELGIEPTTDLRTIKKAYSTRLKQTSPEDDAPGFERLRTAYERAQLLARSGRATLSHAPLSVDSEAGGEGLATSVREDPVVREATRHCAEITAAAFPHEHLQQIVATLDPDDLALWEALESELAQHLSRHYPADQQLLAAVGRTWHWSDVAHPLRSRFHWLFHQFDDLLASQASETGQYISDLRRAIADALDNGDQTTAMEYTLALAYTLSDALGDAHRALDELQWVLDNYGPSENWSAAQREKAEAGVIQACVLRISFATQIVDFPVERMQAFADDTERFVEEFQRPRWIPEVYLAKAWVHLLADELDEGVALVRKALACTTDDDPYQETSVSINLAHFLHLAGRFEEAEEILREAKELAMTDLHIQLEWLIIMAATLLIQDKENQEGADYAEQALRLSQDFGLVSLTGLVLTLVVDGRIATGNIEGALEAAESSLEIAEQIECGTLLCSAFLSLAYALASAGEKAAARTHLERASTYFGAIPIPAQQRLVAREAEFVSGCC